jgi:hypothetical protein
VRGRELWTAVVISAFMAAITKSEGGGNYSRLKRGESCWVGATVGCSMAREKEGAASMAWWCERRSWHSAGVAREEERNGGLKGRTGRRVAGPKFEGTFFSE